MKVSTLFAGMIILESITIPSCRAQVPSISIDIYGLDHYHILFQCHKRPEATVWDWESAISILTGLALSLPQAIYCSADSDLHL